MELFIHHGNKLYEPVVIDDIKWETERKGQPGKLSFSVLADGILDFTEGDAVRFDDVFFGFVFKKERSKDKVIKVTAYDQLRYLKNQATYQYQNATAAEVVKMLASQFQLRLGEIEDTGYKIPLRTEQNKSLNEMIQNALDLTMQARGKIYTLYDDLGKISLKSAENMQYNLMIDEETAEDFNYSSSIDSETYNKVKIVIAGKTAVKEDKENIKKWGVLQKYEELQSGNAEAIAAAMLKFYNSKKRSLTIKNAFGDPKVRAGSSVIVHLNLGDITTQNYMLVEKAIHTFGARHTMDLTLRGGFINA